jgi:hypothetical protein
MTKEQLQDKCCGSLVGGAIGDGGHSDCTGAVAGNIIGAILGYNAVPDKYTKSIQLKELLITTADALS